MVEAVRNLLQFDDSVNVVPIQYIVGIKPRTDLRISRMYFPTTKDSAAGFFVAVV